MLLEGAGGWDSHLTLVRQVTLTQPLFLTGQESRQSTASSRRLATGLPSPTTYHLLTTFSFNDIPAFNA
jgi:hypothetical protein